MRTGFLGSLIIASILLWACSSGADGPVFDEVIILEETDFTSILANSEVVVGSNRLVFGILGSQGLPLVDADVRLSLYDLNQEETKILEAGLVSRVPARDAGIEEQIVHTHADGSRHIHVNVGQQVGVYTAQVTFARGGLWGAVLDGETVDGESFELKMRFNVLELGQTPAIGAPAPLSRNLTADDVDDLSLIDTSSEPSPEMHTSTVADAIAAGRPTMVLFAAPGYCVSQLCGPEFAIMRKLFADFRSQAEFIHVEFFQDPATLDRRPVEVVAEWGLQTEPWFFVIDSDGIITAKFEGPTDLAELREALLSVLP